MADSITSLASSRISESSVADAPVQLSATDAPQRRGSLVQRFASATLDYFSILSDTSHNTSQNTGHSDAIPEEKEPVSLYAKTVTHDDFFGSSHITHSLTRPREEFPKVEEGSKVERDSSETESPQAYLGEESRPEPLRRRQSTVVSAIQNITKKLGFWDEDFHADRIRIIGTILHNYLFLLIGFLAALCVYWGSYYNRTSRYSKVKYAVMIGDSAFGELPPVLGLLVTNFFTNVPSVQLLGNFDVWNHTRLVEVAAKHNNTLQEEVIRQVHHQKYWAAFFVHENATLAMYEALKTGNTTLNPATDLLTVIYETGRDYNAVSNYISSIVQAIARGFNSYMSQTAWASYMAQTLNSTEVANVFANNPALLTALPSFTVDDRIEVLEQVVQAPLQIGLIYLCIFTFFQFLFSAEIHQYISSKIKGLKFVLYRIGASQVAYLVLGLAYLVLNTAFGIKYDKAFGKLGFLVIWAFAYLTMSSVGSLIEILVLTCIILKPPMIGVVLLAVAVTNMAPTISPIVLCPDFYRYGYAMPVPNSYALMQVALFDSWKGNMGRHIGVLFAWIVVTNSAMPFVMKKVGERMAKAKK